METLSPVFFCYGWMVSTSMSLIDVDWWVVVVTVFTIGGGPLVGPGTFGGGALVSAISISTTSAVLLAGPPAGADVRTRRVVVLAPSSTNLDFSLTIYNSSSTPGTLKTMFIIALCGMPLVIASTAAIYTVFKGKVVLDEHSY